jgi:hypothetical protein
VSAIPGIAHLGFNMRVLGSQLFFRSPENRIMVTAYVVRDGSSVAEKPRPWSHERLADLGPTGVSTYDLAPDGNRIVALMPAVRAEDQQHHIVFIENFFDELRPARSDQTLMEQESWIHRLVPTPLPRKKWSIADYFFGEGSDEGEGV